VKKAVVDTGVIACYLLGSEPYVDDLRQFWREIRTPLAPAVWEDELANVLSRAVNASVVRADAAGRRLALAGRLGIQSVPARRLWRGALVRAVKSGFSVYDMLFVELAVREQVPLVTYDARLLAAFPEITRQPTPVPIEI
jgi:predicted nucleic acid-binding protein